MSEGSGKKDRKETDLLLENSRLVRENEKLRSSIERFSDAARNMELKFHELDILIKVSDIVDRNPLNFDALFQSIAQLLGDGWRGSISALIRIEDCEYRSNPYDEKGIEFHEPVLAGREVIGFLKIFFETEGSIDPLEIDVLKAVAERLGKISLRRRALRSLKEQSRIIDNLHESVISRDMSGYITSWNKGAERLFGYTREEALGRHISLVYPDGEYQIIENEGFEELFSKGRYETDVLLKRKDGERFYAHLSLATTEDDQGRYTGMIGFALDIDKRKRTELELEKSKVQLLQESQELERKNIALREVLTHLEMEKQKIGGEVSKKISLRIVPILNLIKREAPSKLDEYVKALEQEIMNITEPEDELILLFRRLTPREIEISTLIRRGMNTKEISARLHLSPETVQKHRRNIRRKLGISGKSVNLSAFLKTRRDN